MNITRKLCLASAIGAALFAAGCNNNNDDEPPVVTDTYVPDSAGVSVAAFIDYLLTLSPDDETSEPLLLRDTFAVPPDDTGDPRPLT